MRVDAVRDALGWDVCIHGLEDFASDSETSDSDSGAESDTDSVDSEDESWNGDARSTTM